MTGKPYCSINMKRLRYASHGPAGHSKTSLTLPCSVSLATTEFTLRISLKTAPLAALLSGTAASLTSTFQIAV